MNFTYEEYQELRSPEAISLAKELGSVTVWHESHPLFRINRKDYPGNHLGYCHFELGLPFARSPVLKFGRDKDLVAALRPESVGVTACPRLLLRCSKDMWTGDGYKWMFVNLDTVGLRTEIWPAAHKLILKLILKMLIT